MKFADMARKALKEIRRSEKLEVRNRPLPYLETDRGLVIPFVSDSRYHWWAGGQTIAATIEELKVAVNA